MVKNYLKIAVRNLLRHKFYSIINILGLSIGMSCAIIIMLWVTNELSFNKFNQNIDKIFVIPQVQKFQTIGEIKYVATPPALAPSIKNENPEIKHATRYITLLGKSPVSYLSKNFNQTLNLVDPDFFKMFDYDLIQGDKNSVLNDPYSVVITKKAASKYFGNSDPMGKELRLRDKVNLTVTGILKDLPSNSDLTFDMISSSELLKHFDIDLNTWSSNMLITFVELQNPNQADGLSKKIGQRIKKEVDLPTAGTLSLFPFKDYHLYSYSFSGTGERIETIYIFSIIAFFILVIACINFTNLTTSRSVKRSTEVGIRKTIGVGRLQIALQFFGESILLTFISLVLAFLLVEAFSPVVSAITGSEINLSQISELTVILVIGATLLTGIISGIYPAIVISSFKPISILRKNSTELVSRYSLQKILVVFQFVVSIILIMGTIVIFRQTQYILNRDLGLSKDNIVYFELSDRLKDKVENLKNELSKNPNVSSVSTTSSVPVDIYVNSGGWSWQGKEAGQEESVFMINADEDFLKTYDINLLAGRYYSKEFGGDKNNSIVINESCAKIIGDENPIGKWLTLYNNSYTIIGVIKDFNFSHIKNKIGPLAVFPNSYPRYLSLKLSNTELNGTLDFIKNTCTTFDQGFVFDYEFIDKTFEAIYTSELKLNKIFNAFTFLAIIVSCLGLFGLISSIAEMKTKEIGIRKVMGASVLGIVVLLSKNFVRWVIFACFVAYPVGFYLLENWLQNFAYRVDITWWVFFVSGGIALSIALATVSFQAIKAAIANPVESLKYE